MYLFTCLCVHLFIVINRTSATSHNFNGMEYTREWDIERRLWRVAYCALSKVHLFSLQYATLVKHKVSKDKPRCILSLFVTTDIEFGEVKNVTSGSSTSFRYTNSLTWNGYIGANIKGRVLQIMGNLPFELATLATPFITAP